MNSNFQLLKQMQSVEKLKATRDRVMGIINPSPVIEWPVASPYATDHSDTLPAPFLPSIDEPETSGFYGWRSSDKLMSSDLDGINLNVN